MSFWNKYGLLDANEMDNGGENTILFTIEYFILMKIKYTSEFSTYYQKLLEDSINKCEIKPGVYSDRPFDNREYNSHDNLTAIAIFSYFTRNNYHKDMWKFLTDSCEIYDNINPNKPDPNRLMHPRDIIFYGYLNQNWICKLLLPFLALIMVVSLFSKKEKTSGKILWYFRNLCLPKIFMSIQDFILDAYYGKNWLKELFKIYFPDSRHPIRMLLR